MYDHGVSVRHSAPCAAENTKFLSSNGLNCLRLHQLTPTFGKNPMTSCMSGYPVKHLYLGAYDTLAELPHVSVLPHFHQACHTLLTTPRALTSRCTIHRLRSSASTVLTTTSQVNGRWRILTPHRIETHEPTATKFRTIDYVRGRTP